jgi:aryl-alcohol dehydrogenase-like predicted oxidoreductase
MKYNLLGRTWLRVSQLGFGCGSIGGLLVRGDYPAMRQAVARAIELGVNYFDTAALYGNGQSEANLGAVLRELRADVLVGTKVRLAGGDWAQIGLAIVRSVEASLRRLGREQVDLIQLHNYIEPQRREAGDRAGLADLEPVARAFEALQEQGKARFCGLTGSGDADATRAAVAGQGFQTVQTPFNMLNPTAALAAPPGFPFQDFKQLIAPAQQNNVGVIAIRILAGGALSGSTERHPVAARSVDPIAGAATYEADVANARRYSFLVEDGLVSNLVEAAVRFAAFTPGVSTALVGISTLQQLEDAVAYVERGPLPAQAIERIQALAGGG